MAPAVPVGVGVAIAVRTALSRDHRRAAVASCRGLRPSRAVSASLLSCSAWFAPTMSYRASHGAPEVIAPRPSVVEIAFVWCWHRRSRESLAPLGPDDRFLAASQGGDPAGTETS